MSPITRANIEEHVRKGQEALTSLKRVLNTDTLINRLHDELLLEIFRCYIACLKKERHESLSFAEAIRLGEHGNFKWIRLTHVCYHWRHLALSYPTFWAEIQMARFSSASAFLSRSQQAPLSIHCRLLYTDAVQRTKKYQLFQKILAESSRIRRLTLSYSNIDTRQAPAEPEMGRCEFPELKTLKLTLESGDEGTAPSFIARCDSFPRLEELRIQNYDLSLTQTLAARVPNLVRLYLNTASRGRTMDRRSLLNFLSSLPQLERLSLCDRDEPRPLAGLNVNAPSTLSFNTVIALPKLSYLRLACQVQSAPILLRHISHPADTKLKLEVDPPVGPVDAIGDELAAFASALGLHMSGSRITDEADPILSFNIDMPAEAGVRICAWTEALPIDSLAGDSTYHSHAENVYSRSLIQIHFLYYSAESIFELFVKALPLNTVQRLFVGGTNRAQRPFVPTERAWKTAFTSAINVTELSVYAQSGRNLPSALCPTVSDDHKDWQVLFPRIDIMRIQHVEFSKSDATRWMTTMPIDGWVLDLQDEESVRQVALRMRLTKLVIRKAVHIDPAHVALLERCLGAAAVDWDGIQRWRGTAPGQQIGRVQYIDHRDPGWIDDDA
ncbi:uncharacterized protein PHACADRAFT_264183 [Phanerochaete carnosa HHB-10118-sp]|uniref:Uncharacterized protein n=1 Tax=Phanerochaete carnosa (strain HHB-10118-sp) TaxID=650164 RepID=K5VVW9_PHACS|nr:uncharacterized protein PHACADRAFT_264183 [Phanerochaete carnosa HHB-10118-sp]EKM50729.1 hypothetical protein PHACADRAFT_264183 [Phanerochaete carnosa HHB-10118-sp]